MYIQEAAKSGPKSVSPDSSDYCPNNWFELKAEEEQEGFVAQLCWKWCFLCVCLPLCYPCYLTRTLRSAALPSSVLYFYFLEAKPCDEHKTNLKAFGYCADICISCEMK